MSKCYAHITSQQRLKIHQLLIQGCAIQEIAQKLGYHRATLYRELARNSCQYGYRPDWASQQALSRRHYCRASKLHKNQPLNQFVIEKLQIGWPPE